MKTLKRENLLSHMKPGIVYRREALSRFSSNLDRDLSVLVQSNKLKKPGTGLYVRPQHSRFGLLPPSDEALVRAFLKKPFLIYSWSDYNKLGLGLTQLYNEVVIYNHERHEKVQLNGRTFSFQRPHNGFPASLTPEFLLIDLLNNVKYITEDVDALKMTIMKKIDEFNSNLLNRLAILYGKVATRKFILSLFGREHVFT
jgi:hypothetical protein